jgi:bacillithiol biosynthesis cysteine-adding enzyme BshC
VLPQFCEDLANIFAQSRQTEFTHALAERTIGIAEESGDLEAFFVRLFTWLMGDRAPVFISPRMEWVKQRAAALLERELAQPGETTRRVMETAERLKNAGFRPGLHRYEDHVNCFVHRDGLRHGIRVAGDSFEVAPPHGESRRIEADGLRAELAESPSQFSPNVVTRPVVRDALLPTVAYVAGPGEVGYLAQLKRVYEYFDAAMPAILARPGACLVEPRIERALGKLGLPPQSAAVESDDELAERLEHAPAMAETEKRLDEARARLDGAVEFAASRVDASDPAVAKASKKLAHAVQTGFEKLAERQRRLTLKRDKDKAAAAATARDLLWPDGHPQERSVTIFFPFLNLLGTRIIDRLFDALNLEAHGTQPIVLSSLMEEQHDAGE